MLQVVKTLCPLRFLLLLCTYFFPPQIWQHMCTLKHTKDNIQHLLHQRSITYLKAWKLTESTLPQPPTTTPASSSLLFLTVEVSFTPGLCCHS